MTAGKTWYAVYTKPRWEKKVAQMLSKRKIENFCPLNKVVKQWADRKKIVYEPLFTSYVFVRTTEAEQLAVKQTDGVVNFVYWLSKPAVIKDEEIDAIRDFLEANSNVTLEKQKVKVADAVRINEGALMHKEGSVLEVYSKTIKVLLPSLGWAMVAEVAKSKVEIIQYEKSSTYC